jgi:hypothetical protein
MLRPLFPRKMRHLSRVGLEFVISSTGLLLGWPLFRVLHALQATKLMPEFVLRYGWPKQRTIDSVPSIQLCSPRSEDLFEVSEGYIVSTSAHDSSSST